MKLRFISKRANARHQVRCQDNNTSRQVSKRKLGAIVSACNPDHHQLIKVEDTEDESSHGAKRCVLLMHKTVFQLYFQHSSVQILDHLTQHRRNERTRI